MVQRSAAASYLDQPLDTLFASMAAVRILRVLARHGGQISTGRISRESFLTKPTVLRVLDDLIAQGIVQEDGSGRARLLTLNRPHPLAHMLDVLFHDESRYRDKVIDGVNRAALGLKPRAVWLFGSAARHEDRPDSDLDILFISAARNRESHEGAAAAFREKLSEEPSLTGLKPSVVALTVNELRALIRDGHSIWKSARDQAKVVVGDTPSELESLARRMDKAKHDAER
ncbi:MarR family transcriptional regulator [Muricoccus vinaceus]|uniref:MarR family transcriptional regulator n=1 Tax=Muricoccus vinaceus TaxID=424704 RepID=A0ABV6IWN6_9PROT